MVAAVPFCSAPKAAWCRTSLQSGSGSLAAEGGRQSTCVERLRRRNQTIHQSSKNEQPTLATMMVASPSASFPSDDGDGDGAPVTVTLTPVMAMPSAASCVFRVVTNVELLAVVMAPVTLAKAFEAVVTVKETTQKEGARRWRPVEAPPSTTPVMFTALPLTPAVAASAFLSAVRASGVLICAAVTPWSDTEADSVAREVDCGGDGGLGDGEHKGRAPSIGCVSPNGTVPQRPLLVRLLRERVVRREGRRQYKQLDVHACKGDPQHGARTGFST